MKLPTRVRNPVQSHAKVSLRRFAPLQVHRAGIEISPHLHISIAPIPQDHYGALKLNPSYKPRLSGEFVHMPQRTLVVKGLRDGLTTRYRSLRPWDNYNDARVVQNDDNIIKVGKQVQDVRQDAENRGNAATQQREDLSGEVKKVVVAGEAGATERLDAIEDTIGTLAAATPGGAAMTLTARTQKVQQAKIEQEEQAAAKKQKEDRDAADFEQELNSAKDEKAFKATAARWRPAFSKARRDEIMSKATKSFAAATNSPKPSPTQSTNSKPIWRG